MLAADDDDQDLDPAAAALSKSRQWVLAALRAGAVQPGQPTAATGVGLDPVTGGGGIGDGAITWQLTPIDDSSRDRSYPVGPAS